MNHPFDAALITAVAALALVGTVGAACSSPSPAPSPTFPAVPPAWPYVFNGEATLGGVPVPAGLMLTGRIDDYRSASVTTQEGRYQALPVGPLDPKYFDLPIVFELSRPSDGKTVAAQETIVFRALPQPSVFQFKLTFPAFE